MKTRRMSKIFIIEIHIFVDLLLDIFISTNKIIFVNTILNSIFR